MSRSAPVSRPSLAAGARPALEEGRDVAVDLEVEAAAVVTDAGGSLSQRGDVNTAP